MKDLEITGIHADATPGSALGNCVREALQMATQEWRNVYFTHNSKTYRVLVNDLVAEVKPIDR